MEYAKQGQGHFKTSDTTLLNGLEPGMEVDFEITKAEGGYRIIKSGPTKKVRFPGHRRLLTCIK